MSKQGTPTALPSTVAQLSTRASRGRALTAVWAGCTGLAIFATLALFVHVRALAGFDVAIAQTARGLWSAALDAPAAATSILLSGEFSLFYALAGCVLLWRAGYGWLSLTPLAFLPLLALELGLKLLVNQPHTPAEFHRAVSYPLATLTLHGSFPSGHATRSGFFFTYLAQILRARGGRLARLAPPVLAGAAVLLGATRLYLGVHWASDVAGGLLLGASGGLLATAPLVRRLQTVQGRPSKQRHRAASARRQGP